MILTLTGESKKILHIIYACCGDHIKTFLSKLLMAVLLQVGWSFTGLLHFDKYSAALPECHEVGPAIFITLNNLNYHPSFFFKGGYYTGLDQ